MKKTFKVKKHNDNKYQFLTLPGSGVFKFEIINDMGSFIEQAIDKTSGRDVYGISHFIEHLGFKTPLDYTTEELMETLRIKGRYNASTDQDRINYWFQTTTENVDTAINVVSNVAFNDLTRINEEEFEMERNVVCNEIRRYADDSQTMFYYDARVAATGIHKHDNILGSDDIVEKFTLEDVINIKNIMLNYGKTQYNVTYDPTEISEEEIINKIETELERHPIRITENDLGNQYKQDIVYPKVGTHYCDNASEQAMTHIFIPTEHRSSVVHFGNDYLGSYATDSLTNIIREQNGLTYGVHFFTYTFANLKPFTIFMCDVNRGNEELLIKLIKESITKSCDNFDKEAYDVYMSAINLDQKMSSLNLNTYNEIHILPKFDPETYTDMASLFEEDADLALTRLNEDVTFDKMREYLKEIKQKVNNDEWSLITNIKD